jgi:acyl-coenzyme A synthetase/AMP-(fatty) acid ligase
MESVLLNSPLVDSIKTIIVNGKRTTIGCVVCLTTEGDNVYKAKGKRQLVQQLKQELSGHFENVVLPRKWRFVSQLPINEQGKTTQAALVSLFEEQP